MTTIRKADLIGSVADALQFISYYHPADYIEHLGRAYEREQSPAAKDAIAQILTNSRMCAEGKRPICQDTGIVNMFLKVGMEVRWETKRSLAERLDIVHRMVVRDVLEGVGNAFNQVFLANLSHGADGWNAGLSVGGARRRRDAPVYAMTTAETTQGR